MLPPIALCPARASFAFFCISAEKGFIGTLCALPWYPRPSLPVTPGYRAFFPVRSKAFFILVIDWIIFLSF
jgi:hypothetical protein